MTLLLFGPTYNYKSPPFFSSSSFSSPSSDTLPL